MLYIFIAFLIVALIGIKFNKINDINDEAMSHDRTLMINGFFVALVLFSHFNSYVTYINQFDQIYLKIFLKIGQLMVTTFLFYSGYGIFESIKNKPNYIDHFLKKRFLKVFIPFALAIVVYMILNLIMGNSYSIYQYLLSFTGWESIGNSNWFMFAVFCMYLATFVSFKIFKKDKLSAILLNFILSLIYIILVKRFKGFDWWYNTILCYNFGMLFSYYKKTIIDFLKNKWHYVLSLCFLVILFMLSYDYRDNFFVYEITAISFVIIVVLLSLKVKIGNKFLLWLGKNTFNIYILQRIGYIIFDKIGLKDYNIYSYFGISVIFTIIIVIIFNQIVKLTYKLLKI